MRHGKSARELKIKLMGFDRQASLESVAADECYSTPFKDPNKR
jgi:hypothetical protein